MGFNILQSTRLLLRPWKLDDVNSIVAGLNNLEISKQFGTKYPYYANYARNYIIDALNSNKPKFAIVLKDGNPVIGGCGIHKNGVEFAASASIWIHKKYQNQGYGTEALIRLLDFAFTSCNIYYFCNYYFEVNVASKRMQEKIGAKTLKSESYSTSASKKVVCVLSREDFYKAVSHYDLFF